VESCRQRALTRYEYGTLKNVDLLGYGHLLEDQSPLFSRARSARLIRILAPEAPSFAVASQPLLSVTALFSLVGSPALPHPLIDITR